jgi:N-acetylglucosamine kinase-like BadF-type ATPase
VIVGIDLGGTKTHVMAEDNGVVVLDRTVSTRSWQKQYLLADETNPSRLFASIAESIDLRGAAIVIGARDLDSVQQMRVFGDRVQRAHDGPTRVVNDVELLAPAAGLKDAIAVIAGTGSKVVGHGADGALMSAGGHGFLVDDEGSAPWIAREAVRAVLEADDEGLEPDVLAHLLMERYGVTGVAEVAHAFAAEVGLTTWARLCPLVFEAADRGSALAASVITAAAAALAHDVGLVHRRGAVGGSVLCAGGVISNQRPLYDALVREIDALGVGLSVSLLTVPPVMGALALAREMCNTTTAR